MVAGELQTLIGRLNPSCRQALEGAVALTLSRQHYNVEIEHWLLKLAEAPNNDVAAILRHFSADPARLVADLTRVLDRFKTGNSRTPALAPNVTRLVREAWLFASIQCGEAAVRSGHLLAAFLTDDSLGAIAREDSRQLGHIKGDELRAKFAEATAGSTEAGGGAAASAGSAEAGRAEGGAPAPGAPSGKSALDQFTTNLTQRARDGHIDPVLGRDAEIRQIVDVLTRRRQNNPILTGEAGVGKTAVVEGFALKVAQGDVPAMLKDVEILSLDLGLLQAGASMKGEFEGRLKAVIDAVKSSPKPIITFIDEAHTLIGAGGAAGTGDAANLLKPALARGEMRTIAATTWAEYKKYFEKDPALTRRFQVVKVEEPGDEAAIAMMRGVVPSLEKHHGVRILAEAAEEAVRLSRRYIPSRQLPDKAVSLLDTAAGRVAVGHQATPAMVEDRQRRIELLDHRLGVFEREGKAGGDYAERIAETREERERVAAELAELETQWAAERDLVDRLRALRAEAEADAPSDGQPAPRDAAEIRAEFAKLDRELVDLQGDRPLMRVAVDGQAIAEVVANWTGIPVGRMQSDQIKTMMNLEDQLRKRVIGQPQALAALAETVRTSRAKLADPRKPIGVFLMVGTSGVGKTETALALAELLYGGEQNMTVINMSEFKEEHKVSTLMGSPPGYVGYGEGGVLTEAVRRRPYSVVLLDEVEKAHPGVQDVFYQVFDKGMLRDGEGRDIDFKNTIVILTSNAGTDLIHRLCKDEATRPSPEALAEALRPELLKSFKPAFLGRCSVVPYFPLSDTVIRQIVELQLNRIRTRFRDNYKAELSWGPDLVEAIAARCTEVESGARNIEYILSHSLLPDLSGQILRRLADGETIPSLTIGLGEGGAFRISDTAPVTSPSGAGEDLAAAG
ncbi:type VI secretion system ATPase TssH [Methylobacterium sp. NEAU 140]|uniref:type VI secretion system ATPase TssH n=1 Tax=Methylobacterium sp. NEAU 140 TaxID=3064945 RepID=UPI002734D061|nr:type VI secretion system ATPase TssH [Methylobacterium sp. NEAU 140]MDP4025128.1 type VI secretion system ATPase TssH [Methylobacterium sp. NEAU 140]